MDADSYTDELFGCYFLDRCIIGSEFVYEKMLEVGKSVKEIANIYIIRDQKL